MSRIVFDTDDLSVIHNPQNRSKTLIVTFGDMLALAVGDTAWGEKPVVSSGYDILSFMSKRRDWFPESRIRAALKVAKTISGAYDRVFLYGGSMGGYGALKYAAAFQPDGVIAFVPQCSIDPSDIADKRYNKYFDARVNTGMKLKPADISGKVLIISDATYPPDEAHINEICAVCADVSRISLWGTEHNATALLASSAFFADLIDYVDGGMATPALVSKARALMKRRFMYHKLIARRLRARRPQTEALLYEAAILKDSEDQTSFEEAIILERTKAQGD